MKELIVNAIFILLLSINSGFKYIECKDDSRNKIIVQLHLDHWGKDNDDVINLDLRLMENAGIFSYEQLQSKVINGIAEWKMQTDEPYEMLIRLSPKKYIGTILLEPGDSIIIREGKNKFSFHGKGSSKFILENRINEIRDSLKIMVSNPVRYNTNSIDDYLEWNKYLNTQLEIFLSLIESYQKEISPLAYRYIKDHTLDGILDSRSDKFASFLYFAAKAGISSESICAIYDSTYAPFTKDWALPSLSGNFFGSWAFVRLHVSRQFKFNKDLLNSELKRTLLYYEYANKLYKGIAREKFLVEFLSKQMIHDLGFIPETERMMEQYYSEPGYPEYKKLMREYENRSRVLVNGKKAPDFTLYNENNEPVDKTMTIGKVVLMDFWFTGCIGCVQMAPIIQSIENRFVNDSNLLFLSISTDKNWDQWRLSNKDAKYTSGSGIKLYTGGQGDEHPMIKSYNIKSYPSLYLLDIMGNVVGNPLPDPRLDKGLKLTKLIEHQLVEGKDGPYVIHKGNTRIAYYMRSNDLIRDTLDESKLLAVSTDEYNKDFQVDLKTKLINEPSVYAKPSKLLVLSDIEGNFQALRKLLQVNNVIDSNYNWIFDNGHLVFNGDLFDRGSQVTECLWLIYSLEEKAKAKGGYVHFVLGNHEIMNLNNDRRYAREKYIQSSRLMTDSFGIYNDENELGRWLRTKNIAEKIGDVLFVHGGMSKEIIELPLDIKGLNDSSRFYYDKSDMARKSTNKTLSKLFNTESSPFWYRSYYLETTMKVYSNGDTVYRTPAWLIDETLKKYGVRHIVTGHTIVADTVSVHYDNKVINVDTKHSDGHSEALLIDSDTYYRVNSNNQKVKLFRE